MVQKGRPRLTSLTAEDTSAASVHNNRRGTDGMPGWPTSADLGSPTLRPPAGSLRIVSTVVSEPPGLYGRAPRLPTRIRPFGADSTT